MERSPIPSDSEKRVRQSTKQTVLEVLREFKSDLEIDPETFDGDFNKYEDCPGITKLFDEAGMDRGNVAHWQLILLACSCCLFPEDEDYSPKGRPVVWTDNVEDSLINCWFTAKREFGRLGVKALFEAMIDRYGPFRIGPSQVMGDPEAVSAFQTRNVKNAARSTLRSTTWVRSHRRILPSQCVHGDYRSTRTLLQGRLNGLSKLRRSRLSARQSRAPRS
jgi:hypothetical protein